ncbi:NAD-dependent epimerase/dehydratase family protein [Rummeliibacillus sp. JY-2-4R]
MKKILILGKSSYIGKNLENWLKNYPKKYIVHSISLRNNEWQIMEFSEYDVVIYMIGIAHLKETKLNANLYFKINRDLAYETAKKAKREHVKQFIYLSSMSVYGIEKGIIDKTSQLNPKSNYGKSKLQAEELINSLNQLNFKVAILRPPMVYGKGCKGNYPKLASFALKLPFFPEIKNKRSMIFIDNLCQFISLIIDDYESGLFFPQNKEYVCTSHMVRVIAEMNNKKIWMTTLFNPIIKISKINPLINKVFGDLVYEKSLSNYKNIKLVPFEESIRHSETY